MKVCEVEDCDRPHEARGLCTTHYACWRRTGSAEPLIRKPVQPVVLPEGLEHEVGEISDLAAGIAAEHLVCADLLVAGWRAFMTDQNCPYDVAVEVAARLIRVQVKATRRYMAKPQRKNWTPSYMWSVRRAGKAGRRTYGEAEFDLLALVALDTRLIAYLPIKHAAQTVFISPPGASSGRQFADLPFEKALAEVTS